MYKQLLYLFYDQNECIERKKNMNYSVANHIYLFYDWVYLKGKKIRINLSNHMKQSELLCRLIGMMEGCGVWKHLPCTQFEVFIILLMLMFLSTLWCCLLCSIRASHWRWIYLLGICFVIGSQLKTTFTAGMLSI